MKKEKFGTLTDPRDGKTYRTVKIGNQVWMAENLNYEMEGSYCYDNDPENAKKYGRLYTWEAAMKAAPEGWHLPSKAEFETLLSAVGGRDASGAALKSTSGWDYDGNGTDSYGFSALPAGYRYDYDDFYLAGDDAYFWSSSERNSDDAYFMNFDDLTDVASLFCNDKNYGLSIRCVKEEE